MDYLTLIPARKNSQRIKNKNLRKYNGISLIDKTIIDALKIRANNSIIVSSDDERILNRSKLYKGKNIKFLRRPSYLSQDTSSIESLILYILSNLYKKKVPKNIIILQPTSPLRSYKHINDCIAKFEKKGLDSIFSVYKEKIFLWNSKYRSITYDYKKRQNTQKMENFYVENGAIFIFKTNKFLRLKKKCRIISKFDFFEMTKSVSIDIDNPSDLKR